jgi:Holliday junction resolvase RusA-like endonuclease
MHIVISLPGLPRSLNGSHGHWRAAAAERKKWRTAASTEAFYILCGSPARKTIPWSHVKIVCTRFSSSPMDFDNLVASFKPILDGIRDAAVITDDTQAVITQREYLWKPDKRGKGRVEVVVECLK